MFTNHLSTIAGIAVALVALAVLIGKARHASYSRRMAKRTETFRPLTYTEARGRGCAACR